MLSWPWNFNWFIFKTFTFGPKWCMPSSRPVGRHIIDWIHSSSFPQTLNPLGSWSLKSVPRAIHAHSFPETKKIPKDSNLASSQPKTVLHKYALHWRHFSLLVFASNVNWAGKYLNFYWNLMPFQYVGKKTSKIWCLYWN